MTRRRHAATGPGTPAGVPVAPYRTALRLLIALTQLLAAGTPARADEVTSMDTVLRGKITGLTGSGITFEPEYGKGSVAIKWEDVQALKTDGAFQILYGDGQTHYLPIQGVQEGNLLVGEGPDATDSISLSSIHSGLPIGPDGPSLADNLRSYWRYWDGNFDLGLNVQQATTDTTGFLLGFKSTRTHAPTRFSLGAEYRYSTEKKRGEEKSTIQDQAFGFLRGEYDLTERFYLWGSGDATYDAIQRLSIRGVPKAGLGIVIWEETLDEEQRNFLSGETGGGWVYEKYFDESDNNYFAVAFGLVAGYYLPYGAHFDGRVDYLPAVDDFTGDYLLRAEAGLTIPLVTSLAAKFSVINAYDSTPAKDTDANSLFLAVGLSLLW